MTTQEQWIAMADEIERLARAQRCYSKYVSLCRSLRRWQAGEDCAMRAAVALARLRPPSAMSAGQMEAALASFKDAVGSLGAELLLAKNRLSAAVSHRDRLRAVLRRFVADGVIPESKLKAARVYLAEVGIEL